MPSMTAAITTAARRFASQLPVSVLIPTKNEEANIAKCLRSVAWADEIFVVDSLSTDRTAEIAQSMGARVIPFRWDGKGPRKYNWSLANLPWHNEWVLLVDADEEIPDALRDEIASVLNSGSDCVGFIVRFDYYFLGRRMRHGDPLWKLVLFKHALGRFERIDVPEVTGYDIELHEHPLIRGQIGRLRTRMVHRDNESLYHHFYRHNIYSDWEAALRTRYRNRDRALELRADPFGTAIQRRRFWKQLFMNLPGKPWLYFMWAYLLRGGFLDGRSGFIYAALKAMHWYQVSVKEYEIRLRANDPSAHLE
jgi:glycosyltransferase involved in cell wall biosynthesis